LGHRSKLSIALDGTLAYDVLLLDLVIIDDRPAIPHMSSTVSTTLSFSFGAMFQQQLRNAVMALRSSCLERCLTRPPLDVHIRPMTKQQPHDL
jgi:hypothetical protein